MDWRSDDGRDAPPHLGRSRFQHLAGSLAREVSPALACSASSSRATSTSTHHNKRNYSEALVSESEVEAEGHFTSPLTRTTLALARMGVSSSTDDAENERPRKRTRFSNLASSVVSTVTSAALVSLPFPSRVFGSNLSLK